MEIDIPIAASGIAPVALTELRDPQVSGKPLIDRKLELVKNVKVNLQIRLGGAELSVQELLTLKGGSVVKLARHVSEPLELTLDGEIVARGELVALGDELGFKVIEISDLSV